jgi:hypothetical protein
VEQSTGILQRIGVEHPGSFLSSLVRSAVDNALTRAGARPSIDEVLDALQDGSHADGAGEGDPGDDGRGWYLRGE